MRIQINIKKLYLVLIAAIFVNAPQLLLFSSSVNIYSIKSSYYYVLYIALLNNFIITFLILWLLFFSKVSLRISTYFLILLNIIFCFYVYNYHIAITGDILSEVINNTQFANSFINYKQILIIIITFLLFIIGYEIILLRFSHNINIQQCNTSGFILVFLIGITAYLVTLAMVNPLGKKAQGRLQMASITYLNFPKNILAAASENLVYYFKGKYLIQTNPYYKERINYYSQKSNPKNYTLSNNNPQTIVFVFGESLNASHLPANGYNRNTTPLLLKEPNVVFIKNTISCATTTSIAQPCMAKGLTTYDINEFSSIFSKYLINTNIIKSFIYIFNHLGFKSTFITIGNNGNSLKLLENEAITRKYLPQIHEKNKEANIKYIENEYKKALKETLNSNYTKKLIIIYLEGSHYTYDNNSRLWLISYLSLLCKGQLLTTAKINKILKK